MEFAEALAVAAALAAVAAGYAAVGHAGASGYAAVFAFAGLAPATAKPTALFLNLLVAALGTWRFRAGFSWRRWWALAAGGVPAAWWTSQWPVPKEVFQGLLGFGLWLAAWRILLAPKTRAVRPLAWPAGLMLGTLAGMLGGLSGTGGGIYLTPMLLLGGWMEVRGAAALTAPFILVVSASGLAGTFGKGPAPAAWWPRWLAAVGIGGALGAELGSRRLAPKPLRWVLGGVLVFAGGELLARAARLR